MFWKNPTMTDQEKMIQILYKAIGEGVAKLIRNGLAFTVMGMAIVGLIWGLFKLHEFHSVEMSALKTECKQMKSEHSVQLNELRLEIAACTMERIKDAARIARLEALIQKR